MAQLFRIEGMHCQGCAHTIERGLDLQGIAGKVDYPSATLTVTSDSSPQHVRDIVSGLGGYVASPVDVINPAAIPSRNGAFAYYPLALIFVYLLAGSLAGASTVTEWMANFMAGFFLIFSFFKLLNLKAFSDSYAAYDLIAGHWRGYGFVYPFIELGFGFAYLFRWQTTTILYLTLAVSIISGIGVSRSVLRRQTIRCACLGTILNVPLSTVTLVEDFGMAAMASLMLIFTN